MTDDSGSELFDSTLASFTNEFAKQGADYLFGAMFRREPVVRPPRLDLAALATSFERLQSTNLEILDVLRHPTRTAADELLDRAQYAYAHGWYDESFDDAERSIAAYPYQATAHLVKALAALATGRAADSVAGLLGAVRYGVDAESPIATTAVLLLADFVDAGDSPQTAIALLDGFRIRRGEVPEVLLALHLRSPDDEPRFRAVIAAFARAGLALDRVGPPEDLHGLTSRMDTYLDVDVPRELRRLSDERAANAIAAQVSVAASRRLPFDPWLLQHLEATMHVAIAGHPRPTWSVRELAQASSVPIGADLVNDLAGFAQSLRLEVDEHARGRVALAPPGYPLADLNPIVATLDEMLALRRSWAERAVGAGGARTWTAEPAAGVGAPPARPAFVVPLALRPVRSPMFSVADLVADAAPSPIPVPDARVVWAKRTVTVERISIATPAQRWEVIIDSATGSVSLGGGHEPIVQPLGLGGFVDLPLVIDGRLHALRVWRSSVPGSASALTLDGESVSEVHR